MHDLRHNLIWEGKELGDYFHATNDHRHVRNRVYEEILKFDFEVQATICEKSKAQPQVRSSKSQFYQYPWFYHLKHGIAKNLPDTGRVFVTAAAIGNRKEKVAFRSCVDRATAQALPNREWGVDFRPAQADPCLQIADYCAWAIQRKWERNDSSAYDLIENRIVYEYDLWKRGSKHYY